MNFKAYIFDLDGTLLDTLPDLVHLTNMVLQHQGWPTRSSQEILSYVGDGGRVLLKRAAPSGVSENKIEEAFVYWEELYPTFGHAETKPYPGILEVLKAMKDQGAKLGVLSNKFDAAVKEVISTHFPNVFDLAWGESVEIPRKPNPVGLQAMMTSFNVSSEETAFIGDSKTDMEVSHNAGTFAVGVTWGYQSEQALRDGGVQLLVNQPLELLSLL